MNKIKYPSNTNKYQCWEFLTFWNLELVGNGKVYVYFWLTNIKIN